MRSAATAPHPYDSRRSRVFGTSGGGGDREVREQRGDDLPAAVARARREAQALAAERTEDAENRARGAGAHDVGRHVAVTERVPGGAGDDIDECEASGPERGGERRAEDEKRRDVREHVPWPDVDE